MLVGSAIMFANTFLVMLLAAVVASVPQAYETKNFKVGIEYDHSLPMSGGSDRYRHRNNYEPFFVTVTVTANENFVISYLEVSATVDAFGKVDFCLTRGTTGSRSMEFQLSSNLSEFLAYSYRAYGIREDEYKKMSNIITIPVKAAPTIKHSIVTTILLILLQFILLS